MGEGEPFPRGSRVRPILVLILRAVREEVYTFTWINQEVTANLNMKHNYKYIIYICFTELT